MIINIKKLNILIYIIYILVFIIAILTENWNKTTTKLITLYLTIIISIFLLLNKNINKLSLLYSIISLSGILIDFKYLSLIHMLYIVILLKYVREIKGEMLNRERLIYLPLLIILITGLLTLINSPQYYQYFNACIFPIILTEINNRTYKYKNDVYLKAITLGANNAIIGFLLITFLSYLFRRYSFIVVEGRFREQLTGKIQIGIIDYYYYPTMIGILMSAGIIISVHLYLYYRNNRAIIYFLLYTLLSFLIASRAATVGILISLLNYMLFHFIKNSKGNIIVNIVKISTIILIIFIFISNFTYYYGDKVIGKFYNLLYSPFDDINFISRIDLIIHSFQDNGILGKGFGYLWNRYYVDESNLISWVTYGIGILGTIMLFIYWIILLIKYTKKYIRANSEDKMKYVFAASLLIGVLVASFSDNTLYLMPNYTAPILFTLIAHYIN